MNKKIKSTIIIGIFLLFSILYVIILIPFNLKEAYSSYLESVQNNNDVEGEMIIMVHVVASIVGLAIIIRAYLPAFLALINSSISLIFSIKNRKSSLKSIRIVNYCYDVILGAIVIFAIVKIILFATGIG